LSDFNDSGMDSNIATPLAGSSLPDNDVDDDMNLDDAGPGEQDEPQTPSPEELMTGSAAVSGEQSPQAALDNTDVQMEDADAVPAPNSTIASQQPEARQEVTPPDSPPHAPQAVPQAPTEAEIGLGMVEPAVKAEITVDDAAVSAHEEGRVEREKKIADGEIATEPAADS
jgi:hypothetical protein